jgi:hypothetical protein
MYIIINIHLVGGFNPSEKYLSNGITLPNMWKNRIHVPNHQPDIINIHIIYNHIYIIIYTHSIPETIPVFLLVKAMKAKTGKGMLTLARREASSFRAFTIPASNHASLPHGGWAWG